jgi:quercetin dioxygenase-like cupin family protein
MAGLGRDFRKGGKVADERDRYQPGDEFHSSAAPVYRQPLDWAVNKTAGAMARVVYDAPHFNAGETGIRRGQGKDFATWVFCEEAGKAEGLLRSGLELVIDARLEPGAAVGLHTHDRTEEIYYILEGSIRMTTLAPDGQERTADLLPGDAHLVRSAQRHFGQAGRDGVRMLVISARVGNSSTP